MDHSLAQYGYVTVALLVAAEGLGIPLPGETALIAEQRSPPMATSHSLGSLSPLSLVFRCGGREVTGLVGPEAKR